MNKIFGLLVLLTFSFSTLASDFGTVKFQTRTDDFTEKTTEFVKISGMEGKLDITIHCHQGDYVYLLQVGVKSDFRFNRTSIVDVRNPDNMILEASDLLYARDLIALFVGDRNRGPQPTAIPILYNAMVETELNAAKPENDWLYHIRVRARSGSNTETDSFKVTGFSDALEKLNCSK